MFPRAPQAAAALGLLLVFAPGGPTAAPRACVTLHTEKQGVTYPVLVGSPLHLSFRHSIYGSRVEEQFQVAPDGFWANKLRYAELRLVEFYGYESATNEDGWWVVHNPRKFSTLDLRVSREASIRVTFLDRTIFLRNDTAPDGRARLSVSACPGESHG